MTNQEKFVQIFDIVAWQAMIVPSGLAEQFKEYWTSPYSERVDNLEKKIIEEKDKKIEKLKAELDYTKFRCSLPDINMNIKEKRHGTWWECKKCGKMIPYMANFCHECADELLGDQPKPFDPTESEEQI